MGPGVVIESGGNPTRGVVAVVAMGSVVLGNELSIVSIFVARFALFWRSLEARLCGRCRFVAIGATNGAVCTKQREFGLRMVEAIDVGPRLNRVARFATKGCAVRSFAGHVLVEFAFVRVFVASRAGTVLEFEGENLVGTTGKSDLMAVRASYSCVCSEQRIPRIAVLFDRVGSAVPIGDRMAIFAAVLVRSSCKLIIVGILVTISAELELNFVNGVLARRNVALRAVHLYVSAL